MTHPQDVPAPSPTVSEAMREGILHDEVQALIAVAKRKVAERDARIAALERDNAALRAERDEVRANLVEAGKLLFDAKIANDFQVALIRNITARAETAEAELATLRASAERMETEHGEEVARLRAAVDAADLVIHGFCSKPIHKDQAQRLGAWALAKVRAALNPKETPDA